MSEKQAPEFVPDSTPVDRIVDLAIDLVDSTGSEVSPVLGPEMSTAIFYVPDNENDDGRYPSLQVTVPKEKFFSKYEWRAQIAFGEQDPKLSSNILVKKDGTIRLSNYEKHSKGKIMSDEEVESLEGYLKQIQPNLISDSTIK